MCSSAFRATTQPQASLDTSARSPTANTLLGVHHIPFFVATNNPKTSIFDSCRTHLPTANFGCFQVQLPVCMYSRPSIKAQQSISHGCHYCSCMEYTSASFACSSAGTQHVEVQLPYLLTGLQHCPGQHRFLTSTQLQNLLNTAHPVHLSDRQAIV